MSTTALSTATHAPAAAAVLTANDRCDRCGSQAYLSVRLNAGGELLFCGHHARQYGSELDKIAVTVTDQTGCLTPSP